MELSVLNTFSVNEYYVKNGRRGNKEVEFSPMYSEQKQSTADWSDAWTRYNSHIRKSCSNLGMAPRTRSSNRDGM